MDVASIKAAIPALEQQHFLAGLALDSDCTVLLTQLQEKISPRHLDNNPPNFFPWAWSSEFGNSVTITAGVRPFGFIARISLDDDKPAFRHLFDQGSFQTVLIQNHTPIRAYTVNFKNSQAGNELLDLIAGFGRGHHPALVDPAVHYWWVLSAVPHWDSMLTPTDLLRCGWAELFGNAVSCIKEDLAELPNSELSRQPVVTDNLPQPLVEFLNIIKQHGCQLKPLFQHFERAILDSNWLREFFRGFTVAVPEPFDHIHFHFQLARLVKACFLSGRHTQYGTTVAWVDTYTCELEALTIQADEFTNPAILKDFWKRLEHTVSVTDFRLQWGAVISGTDYPASEEELKEGWKEVRLDCDLTEAQASIDAILEEAVANKHWCIPPQATVELKLGPFSYVQLSEVKEEIYFVLRDAKWQFFNVYLNPQKRLWSPILFNALQERHESGQGEVEASLKLLLAAIVRDFWVVEEREKVFATKSIPAKVRAQFRGSEEFRIVYLPRIRYNQPPNLTRCEQDFQQRERRKHFVSAHLRKTDAPSEHQLILAQVYGFSVPAGYTFVRPHERGVQHVQTLYRSRSVLNALYKIEDSTPTPPERCPYGSSSRRMSPNL